MAIADGVGGNKLGPTFFAKMLVIQSAIFFNSQYLHNYHLSQKTKPLLANDVILKHINSKISDYQKELEKETQKQPKEAELKKKENQK